MKKNFIPKNLIRQDGNELIFDNLSNPRIVSEFVGIPNKTLNSYNKHLILNFKNVKSAFPNVCVPLAGIIENISLKGINLEDDAGIVIKVHSKESG